MNAPSTTDLHAQRVAVIVEIREGAPGVRRESLEAELADLDRKIVLRLRYLGMAR